MHSIKFLSVACSVASVSVAACSRTSTPIDGSVSGQTQTTSGEMPRSPMLRPVLPNGERAVVLTGAAALAYMYEHPQETEAKNAVDGRLHVTTDGRLYYRDSENAVHFVSAPTEGLTVPESDAAAYRQYQGYGGSAIGRDFSDLSTQED